MRFPTGTEVARLRSGERNFSQIFLGVQRGKERTDSPPPLMVGQHYALIAADTYDTDEHHLTFNVANFLLNSDIRPNMTLGVGTLADPFAYGSVRIREVDIANNRLCLEPNNLSAEGYLATGDYIWVDGVYRLYRKLPYIVTGTVYEDGNPDTLLGAPGIPGYGIAFNVNYLDRPVALMGSPRFAWAGEEIDFYGWRSHGRGGRTIQGWTWDFDGGVCVGPGVGYPGSPGHPIHVRWDSAGEYIASLVVTDNSGNAGNDDYGVQFNRHRAVRPVLVYDRPGEGANTPYENFEVESLTGKYGSGWSCRITVFGTADKTEFPDNALIIVYAEDWHGGQQGSIGGWYGQEGILFCGYIRADSVVADFEKSTVSFEAETIEQWMKEIDIWPMNCVSTAGAPTKWHDFQAMTVEDVLWYLTEMKSNLKDITDCFFASDVGAEKTLGFVDLTEASLYNQMSEQLGSCFFGKLSAGRHGSVHLAKHKNMLDMAERMWWGPPIYSFSKQDWRDEIQIGEERQRNSVAQVDFVGFVYDTNGNPLEVYSLAPARQTNFGGIEKVSGVLLSGNSIAAGQAENNTLAGLYLAWKNIRFPHIRVPTRHNNRVLEPATLDYFAVVLEEADTERGYIWEGKEWLCTGVSVKIDNENGIIDVDIEGEASTWGPDGVAGEYPYGEPYPDPPSDNPPEYWPVWPPPVGLPADGEGGGDPPPWAGDDELLWPITIYMALWSGHVIRGVGLGPEVQWSQNCEYFNLGQSPTAGNLFWMALDQFDSVNTAMVCTYSPNEVWKITDLGTDSPTWTKMFGPTVGINGSNIRWTMVQSSSLQSGLWMVAGYEPSAPASIYIRWSLNGGDSWNATNFTSGDAESSYTFLEMSTHDANRAWAMWVDWNNRTYIAETNDMWASQTLTSIPLTCFSGLNDAYPNCHHRGYQNDDDSEVLYGGNLFAGGPGNDYARVYYNGTCVTLYTETANIPDVPRVGCGVGTLNRWWALASNDNTEDAFWISDDGINWTKQSDWVRSALESRDCRNHSGDWQSYMYARDGPNYPLAVSIDRGENWDQQQGNWVAFVTDEGLGSPDVMCVCSRHLLP